jgi:hypothetical protein
MQVLENIAATLIPSVRRLGRAVSGHRKASKNRMSGRSSLIDVSPASRGLADLKVTTSCNPARYSSGKVGAGLQVSNPKYHGLLVSAS